jgi:GTP:adenosylcobinamide-phosphate guanylyltransferase
MIASILLGGGRLKNSLPKSLIKFKNQPLIIRLVRALENSKYVSKLILILPEEAKGLVETLELKKETKIIEAGNDLIERIFEALKLVDTEYVLILPVDVPLVNEEVIDGFIEECLAIGGDAFYPIIKQEVIEKKFPGTKRTYGRLKEGVFTGGNIFLVKKDLFYLNRRFIEEIYQARKNSLKMARVAGITVLIKGLLGKLEIKDAESRVSRLFNNAELKAVITRYPELGIDVDKDEDLEFLLKLEEAEKVDQVSK